MSLEIQSDISWEYVNMQNEIAAAFKKLVIEISNVVEGNNAHVLAMFREMHDQQFSTWTPEEDSFCYLAYEVAKSISKYPDEIDIENIYHSYMDQEVFYYSSYNSMDMRGDANFIFSASFRELSEKAIKQFCMGKSVLEKVSKQVAIIRITEKFKEDNIKLTLRQLYYQLVSQNIIANKEAEYKKLIDLTGNMRENCVLKINEFADNTRFALYYNYETDPYQYLEKRISPHSYFRSSRENQPNYIEVWIEKEALRSVFKPVTDEMDVPLFICRGYPSTSSLYDQAMRIMSRTRMDETRESIEDVYILYFGDHDPSGLQIPEAIEEILRRDYKLDFVHVIRCGLRMDQIKENNLPPNPAKMTDPRAAKYSERFGEKSWELDAVPPTTLQDYVRNSIKELTDFDIVDKVKRTESEDRSRLQLFRRKLREFWNSIDKE
ncbi:hypothetical protein D1872_144120 [compost metagenome]